MNFDQYIYAPSIIIGGEAHGTVVDPGRNLIQIAKFKAPRNLYDPTGDTRPFADDVITSEVKTIPIKMLAFRMPFAIDDSEGLNEEAVLGLLNSLVRDIQGRMLEELYQRESRERMLSPRRYRPKPSILDRRSWVTNFFNKFFPKKPATNWELRG